MDRVSSLPDEILCHILSFVPTKQAAVTSSLSRRWVNVWKLVPNLDIDDSVFLHPEDGKGEREDIRSMFVDFVDRVLAMQGDSPIEKFSLKSITCVDGDTVNRWICNVLQRGVSDLDLFTDFNDDEVDEEGYYLPQELYVSKTLVRLKLRSERSVDMGDALLPMLKSLYIDSEMIFYGEMETFLPSFPALEEIRMANIEWRDPDVKMSSASLKKLKIHGTGVEEYENPKSISFDTPNLLSLSYSDLVAVDYPLVNMNKLEEARINLILKNDQIGRLRASNNDLIEEGDEENEGDVVLQFGNVVKLMNGIQNVQRLSLLSDTLEVLSLCCESMLVFNNLKTLSIKSKKSRGWQALPVIISKCPHLESIIIEGLVHHVTDKCGDACPCISREEKGRSLSSCPIKLLQVQGFRGTMKEMHIINHFLVYFPCLEEMKVYIEEHDPTQLKNREVSKLILEMFRLHNELSSCNVQLLVSDYLNKKWTAQGRT